jgi:16S rRNA (guanine527-N7)-methyltransferase
VAPGSARCHVRVRVDPSSEEPHDDRPDLAGSLVAGPEPSPHVESAEWRQRILAEVEPTLVRSAELGFLGSMTIVDQINHSLGFVAVAEAALGGQPEAVVDLGSGGGVPGLVLLACWPECRLVLLDSNERRTDFLIEATSESRTGERVEVIRGRAEEIGHDERFREQFDLVTSRSFASPAVTAECGAALMTIAGLMVVSEPPDQIGDRWPVAGLARLGLEAVPPARFEDLYGYQPLRKVARTDDRYPRRVGIPTKRPLF